ncbi:alpha-L-fucosidase [Microbacterium sp. HJ5]
MTRFFTESTERTFGLFFHFLPSNSVAFDMRISRFDVARFVAQCADVGATYLVFTLGQSHGFLNAPNSAYERLTGSARGTRTPERDLVGEIIDAAAGAGLATLLYTSALAGKHDVAAAHALGCTGSPDGPTEDFRITDRFASNWAAVLEDFSRRYGPAVRGWWVDGCYPWVGFGQATADLYASALKAGNPDTEISFNHGEGLARVEFSAATFTAGEFDFLFEPTAAVSSQLPTTWHQLSHITEDWGRGPLVYDAADVARHIRGVNEAGGFVTLDVPLSIPMLGDQIRPDARSWLDSLSQRLTAP